MTTILWQLPGAGAILIVALLLLVSAWSYARALGRLSLTWAVGLFLVRLIVIILLFILLSPTKLVRQTARQEKPLLTVVLDTSESMGVKTFNPNPNPNLNPNPNPNPLPSMKREDITAWQQAQRLLTGRGSLLTSIAQKARVEVFTVGESVKPISKEALPHLSPQEKRSNLSHGILSLITQQARAITHRASRISHPSPFSLHPSLVVLISDGQDTNPIPQAQLARALHESNLRVITVGVGEPSVTPDVEVALSPEYTALFPNTVFSLQASVTIRPPVDFKGTLTLREGSRVVARQSFQLFSRKPSFVANFEVRPKSQGETVYRVDCTPAAGELIITNNEALSVVRVVGRHLRLLYLQGAPSWEYKFVKRALEGDGGIDLLCLVQKPNGSFYAQGNLIKSDESLILRLDRKMLEPFDVILLGDIPARTFAVPELEQIRWFVAEQGGGLMALGGLHALGAGGYADTPVAQVLPTRLSDSDGFVNQSFVPLLTSHNLPSFLLFIVGEHKGGKPRKPQGLPSLDSGNLVGAPKPSAIVLLEYPPNVAPAGRRVLLALHSYGRGRAAVFATDTTWRWCMESARRGEKPQMHQHFWRQMVRQLADADRDRKLTLVVERAQAFAGETVAVAAKWLVPGRGVKGRNVTVEAISIKGQQVRATAKPTSQESGSLTCTLRPPRVGKYVVTATASAGMGRQAERSNAVVVSVTPNLTERQHCGLNERFLKQLSRLSGGQYFRFNQTAQLVEMLKRQLKPRWVKERQEIDIASLPPLYALLFALLSLEWLARRKYGLT